LSSQKQNSVKGRIIIISGPSGVGKSTICKELVKRLDNIYLSVSTTAREKRPGEQDGKEYHFVSRAEFEKQIKDGNFLEYAEVFGNLYGTPKDKLDHALEQGRTAILEIDVQGAQNVKRLYPDAKLIFVLPPKHAELQRRIDTRGRDGQKDIEKRLQGAGAEIAAGWQHYECIVINDDLEQAVEEIIEIIKKINGE
jgi:guanylate kinase